MITFFQMKDTKLLCVCLVSRTSKMSSGLLTRSFNFVGKGKLGMLASLKIFNESEIFLTRSQKIFI